MFVNNLDPVILSVGPLDIRWYGLVYVISFIAFYYMLQRVAKLSTKEADSLVIWSIIGVIIGARAFFFLFYRPDLFSVKEFFSVWNGGLSYYGGLTGIIIAGLLWCRKHKKNFWVIADTGALMAPWAFALGRVANFINGEIVGKRWDGPWCVVFKGYEGCRHPAQLYASVRNIITGALLLLAYIKRPFKPGFIFWSYAALYGLGRAIVNSYRDDPIALLGLMMGQVLSLILLAVAVTVLVSKYREDLKKVFSK